MTPVELSSEIRAAFAYAARYLFTLAESDPHVSAADLLARPDVDAALHQVLDRGRELAQDGVRSAWGSQPHSEYLEWLLADVDRSYDSLAVLRAGIKEAWRNAPTPAERALTVKWAVLAHGEDRAVRNRLSAEVAAVATVTEAELAKGAALELAGEKAWKRWRCRSDPPDEQTCHWCRALHGMVIPLNASFPAGEAADLTGHGRLTKPPKLYHGVLRGPPRHPRCRCGIIIITSLPAHEPAPLAASLAPPGFVTAADIRAIPEGPYQALLHFLEAAVHELGQVLGRIKKAVFRGWGG